MILVYTLVWVYRLRSKFSWTLV